MPTDLRTITKSGPPLWLHIFTLAIMIPACAINGAFVVLTIPKLAPFGFPAIIAGGIVGGVLGILPARWLAKRIHLGLSE